MQPDDRPGNSTVKVLLMSDMVDSTQLGARLGDEAMGEVWRKHGERLRPRQMIPTLLVAMLAVCLPLALWTPWMLVPPLAYALGVAGATAILLLRSRTPCVIGGLAALPAMHLSWGSGFLSEVLAGRFAKFGPSAAAWNRAMSCVSNVLRRDSRRLRNRCARGAIGYRRSDLSPPHRSHARRGMQFAPYIGETAWGGVMVKTDRAATGDVLADHAFADLEAQLLRAVSDFGLQELNQMLDVAEVIRRSRRV